MVKEDSRYVGIITQLDLQRLMADTFKSLLLMKESGCKPWVCIACKIVGRHTDRITFVSEASCDWLVLKFRSLTMF
jgi:hypothetical protein